MLKRHLISILYGCAALCCGSFALFGHSDSLNISVHDTYFVMAKSHLWLVLTLLFILFFGISLTFELLQKPLNRILALIHYLLTTGSIIGICLTVQKSQPARYSDYSVYQDFNQATPDYDWVISLSTILCVLFAAQFVFLLNVIACIFRKIPKKSD